MDIICRWRDAISDPPPDGKAILLHGANADELLVAYRRGAAWYEWEGHYIRMDDGDQWLDVTTIPAVAVSKVQAAVDEMKLMIGRVAEGMYCDGDDPCVSDPIINAYASGMDVIRNHTGVTPSEVKP